MDEKIVCAGFGGQGVMLIGQLLAYAGMMEGRQVSWLPSYGPEMRGGTANCNVHISDEMVGSPIITNDATCAIVMNMPSLVKFEGHVASNGLVLVNSSLIEEKVGRKDVKPYYIPANEIAIELGNDRVANMVMLGAYVKLSGAVSADNIIKALSQLFSEKKSHLIEINKQALARGAAAV